MSGTKSGSIKAKRSIIERHGEDFWKRIGQRGGLARVPKGFSLNHEFASKVGAIGGRNSKRRKKVTNDLQTTDKAL